jgi:hypothetical protein
MTSSQIVPAPTDNFTAPISQLSPEIQLILYCSRTQVSSEVQEKIIALVKSPMNWQEVIKIANRHSVLILLYQSLQKVCPELVPINILGQLRQDFRTNSLRNLYLTRELLQLLDLFEQHNISAIGFKGPLLATSIYGDIALRQFSDLDFLVAEKDVVKAKKILLAQGNKMRFHVVELDEKEESNFLESDTVHRFVRECAYEFDYYNAKFVIELHWEVIPKYFAFPLTKDYLQTSLVTVNLLNKYIPSLSPENNLLLLCGHGTKDCWDKLLRICDIAELLRTHPNLDWQLIFTETKKRGGMRILLSGLLLAHNLLEAEIPPLVSEAIKADLEVEKIVIQAQERLFWTLEKRNSIIKLFFFHLQTKYRLIDKIWYTLSIFMTPTVSDWAILPKAHLPALFYYLIRPLRMLSKWLFGNRRK